MHLHLHLASFLLAFVLTYNKELNIMHPQLRRVDRAMLYACGNSSEALYFVQNNYCTQINPFSVAAMSSQYKKNWQLAILYFF